MSKEKYGHEFSTEIGEEEITLESTNKTLRTLKHDINWLKVFLVMLWIFLLLNSFSLWLLSIK